MRTPSRTPTGSVAVLALLFASSACAPGPRYCSAGSDRFHNGERGFTRENHAEVHPAMAVSAVVLAAVGFRVAFFLAVGVAAVLVAADFVAVVRVVAPLVVALFVAADFLAADFLAAVERVRVVVASEAVVSLPACTPHRTSRHSFLYRRHLRSQSSWIHLLEYHHQSTTICRSDIHSLIH